MTRREVDKQVIYSNYDHKRKHPLEILQNIWLGNSRKLWGFLVRACRTDSRGVEYENKTTIMISDIQDGERIAQSIENPF